MEFAIENASNVFEKLFKNISVDAPKTETFLSVQNVLAEKQIGDSKMLYDLGRLFGSSEDLLSNLITDGFDIEQIWQQIELVNAKLPGRLKKLNKMASALSFGSNLEGQQKKRKILAIDGQEKEQAKKVRFEDDEEEEESEAEGKVDELSDGSDEEDNELKNMLKRYQENEKKELDRLKFDDDGDDEDDADNYDYGDGKNTKKKDDDASEDEDDLVEESDDEPLTKFKESLKKAKEESGKTEKKGLVKQTKGRKFSVDDKFFKLSSMEAFLDREDLKEQRKIDGNDELSDDDNDDDDDEIDMFKEGESSEDDDEASNLKYESFFDDPDEKESSLEKMDEGEESQLIDGVDSEDGDGSEDEEDENNLERELIPDENQFKSPFERRKEMMNEKISELEESNLAEKPWQLKGEVSASNRPENSLMEEVLEYDTATKPATLITEEICKSIEDKILQRLKDNVWDGPKRKTKTREAAFSLKKTVVLDQNKSKLSLEKIYEDEYLQQAQKDEEKTPPEYEEIKKSMTSLFIKLDALSNFHYTPKPKIPEVKIITNVSAMTMEEVAPVGVSDVMLLAPEEIKEKQRRELVGTEERSKTDKKRSKREKKRRQHFIRLHKEKIDKIKKIKTDKSDALLKLKRELKTGEKMDKKQGGRFSKKAKL